MTGKMVRLSPAASVLLDVALTPLAFETVARLRSPDGPDSKLLATLSAE